MLRICLIASVALLAGCSTAKPEDLTARYAREGQPALIVMAAANGDSRISAGDTLFLRKGTEEYVVLHDATGDFGARIDDALAVFGEDQPGALTGPRPEPAYVLTETGAERVLGVKGIVWRGHVREAPAGAAFEAVVSTDPALAPLGRALAMQTRFAILRNSAIGGGSGNFEKVILELFAKGAVLRLNSILRLERIDKAPIPASTFALPEPLLGRDALRTRLRQPPKI